MSKFEKRSCMAALDAALASGDYNLAMYFESKLTE